MRGPSLPTGSHSLGFMRAGSSRGIDASLTEIPFPSRFANITATKSLSSLNQFFFGVVVLFLSLSLLEFQLLPYSTPHSKWRYSIQFGRMTLKLIERRNVAERMEQMTSQNGPNLDIYIYIYIYFYIGSFFIYLRVYLYLSIYLCAFWFLPCKMTLIDLNKQDNRTVDGNRVASPSDTTIIIIYLFI